MSKGLNKYKKNTIWYYIAQQENTLGKNNFITGLNKYKGNTTWLQYSAPKVSSRKIPKYHMITKFNTFERNIIDMNLGISNFVMCLSNFIKNQDILCMIGLTKQNFFFWLMSEQLV